MRKWITLLMTCLVVGNYANAFNGQVNLEAGYRRDNISWKNRFPSDDPKYSSTERFKDLDIFQLGVDARSSVGCNFYVRANAYWGWILDGDFEQSFRHDIGDSSDSGVVFGFEGRNKTVIDDKYVYGVGAAIGYPFFFCDCTTVIAPVIGYAFDEQSVQLDNKRFDQGSYAASGCGDRCCRQTFNSRWYGPFVGVDFNYHPYCSCWNIYGDVEFHWGDFRGRRNHAQYDDSGFNNHNPTSHDSRGWVFDIGAEYDLNNCWAVGFSLKFQDWNANRHHHRDVSGSYSGNYGDKERNNNKWRSYAINFVVGKEF